MLILAMSLVCVCVSQRKRPEGQDAPVHTEHSTDCEKKQRLRTPRPSACTLCALSVGPKINVKNVTSPHLQVHSWTRTLQRDYLGTDCNARIRILAGEDVHPGTSHGRLESRETHPLTQEVVQSRSRVHLKHTLILLKSKSLHVFSDYIQTKDKFKGGQEDSFFLKETIDSRSMGSRIFFLSRLFDFRFTLMDDWRLCF